MKITIPFERDHVGEHFVFSEMTRTEIKNASRVISIQYRYHLNVHKQFHLMTITYYHAASTKFNITHCLRN